MSIKSDSQDFNLSPEERRLTDLIVEASRKGFSSMELAVFERDLGEVTEEVRIRKCTAFLEAWLIAHPQSLSPQLPDGTGFPV